MGGLVTRLAGKRDTLVTFGIIAVSGIPFLAACWAVAR